MTRTSWTNKRPTRKMVEDMIREEALAVGVPDSEAATARTHSAAWVRHRVIQRLCAKGYTLTGIGHVMGLDHSTVRHARNRDLPAKPRAPSVTTVKRWARANRPPYAGAVA